jgi:proteic killer suppression protein
VIVSFKSAEAATIWEGKRSRRLPSEIQDVALRKLRLLNAARRLEDLRIPPGNRLEPLKGDRRGQWSIRINGQWRICFRWSEAHGGPSDVEVADYH